MFMQKLFKFFGSSRRENSIVLVVDDNIDDLNLVSDTAIKGGFNVLKANKGLMGLELAFRHKPDLIILDVNLPDIQGVEICRRLKEDASTKDIPIIFLTMLDAPRLILDSYEYGAENYLLKPISSSLLLKQIEMALRDRHASAAV